MEFPAIHQTCQEHSHGWGGAVWASGGGEGRGALCEGPGDEDRERGFLQGWKFFIHPLICSTNASDAVLNG